MKSAKIVRTIDDNGRVVIPKHLIKDIFKARPEENISVEVLYTEDSVILKRFQPSCSFCDSCDGLKEYNGMKICPDCLEKIKQL
ncbi:MAG: AbrB family transcriptional regulator [Oscillospiraceae bacterium]|nr:AbrB family transcriptional regulator [Oscillospiraceae bacterium]